MAFRLFGVTRQPASVNDTMTGTPLQPVQSGYSGPGHLAVPASSNTQGAPFVSRVPRQRLRRLYSYGAQKRDVFHMRATGQVESSVFQPYDQGMLYNAEFNDGLFEAGHPRNLGISVKLGTTPDELKRGDGPMMQPQAQARVSIFTRRAFYGSPTLPAKPASS